MRYSVLYRNKNGKQERLMLEAKNREQLFLILASQGINAIKIEPAVNTDKGYVSSRNKSSHSMFLKYVALSIIIVVLIIVAALRRSKHSGSRIGPYDKDEMSISTESLHKTSDLVSKYKTKISQDRTENYTVDAPLDDTNNLDEKTVQKSRNKNFRIVSSNKNGEQLFHTVSDIYISRLVNSTPGNAVIGTMNYDKFKEQFIKSLSQPIIINENDSEEAKMKKQAVIDTRAELKQMLDNGQDIAQIMREAESEMRRLWQYRRALHLELSATFRERSSSIENMQNYIDAANKMLKENGLEPLKHPQFWIRRLQNEEINKKPIIKRPLF